MLRFDAVCSGEGRHGRDLPLMFTHSGTPDRELFHGRERLAPIMQQKPAPASGARLSVRDCLLLSQAGETGFYIRYREPEVRTENQQKNVARNVQGHERASRMDEKELPHPVLHERFSAIISCRVAASLFQPKRRAMHLTLLAQKRASIQNLSPVRSLNRNA